MIGTKSFKLRNCQSARGEMLQLLVGQFHFRYLTERLAGWVRDLVPANSPDVSKPFSTILGD
jgi:hypothetical protein